MQVFLCFSQSDDWHFSSQYWVTLQAPQKYNHRLSWPQVAHFGVPVEIISRFSPKRSTNWASLQQLSSSVVTSLASEMAVSSSILFFSFSSRVTDLKCSSLSLRTSQRHCRTCVKMSLMSSSVSLFSLLYSRSNSSRSALNFFRSFLISGLANFLACFLTVSSNEDWSSAMLSLSRAKHPWTSFTPCSIVFSNLTAVFALT